MFETDEAKWAAIVSRDPLADQYFVYGVRTTGVFCRPSCPSRRPRRANVRFFSDGKLAERSGFRRCCKCNAQPKAAPEAVLRACRLIEQRETPFTLGELSARFELSPSHFQRLFTRTVGVSPKRYFEWVRSQRFREGLNGSASVTEAIFAAGFGSSSRAYESSSETLGMTPTQYKKGGTSTRVRFTLSPCSLGWLLVAATERGVCLTSLADEPEALQERVKKQFPNAELEEEDTQLAAWVEELVALIDSPGQQCEIPLDIRGSAFQMRVWDALRGIPAGETASYSEIARRVGSPAAVRAVGTACGSNPVAPIIPCHRVLRSDGSLGGYGFGLERKTKLLEREKPAMQNTGSP